MKRPLLLLFAFTAGAFGLAAQPAVEGEVAADGSFFFVQISDPQLGFREAEGWAESDSLLRRTVEAINRLRPAFVVVTGDMVDSSDHAGQLEAYRRLIGEVHADIPVFHLPGNHDIGKYSSARKAAYRARYGYDRFAFRFGDCAFIGIDSCPIKEGAAPDEAEQYAWLCDRLEQMQACRLKFVFQHHPIVLAERHEAENYSNLPEAMRARYIALFERWGVDALFAGHLHNTAACTVGTLQLITCGPSGKPLGTGFSGLCIVTVRPDGFSCRYVSASEAERPLP